MAGTRTPTVRELGTATAFPSGARPGDILVGQAGAIDGLVAVVNDAGVPVSVPVGSSFVPSNNNLTDAGDDTHAFRSLYLGTSIINPLGDLTIDLRDLGTSVLRLENTTGPNADLSVEGQVSWSNGAALPAAFTLGGTPTGARTLTAQDASGTLAQFTAGGVLNMLADATNDLGTQAARARDLWLSRAIKGTGNVTIDLQSVGATTLRVENSLGGEGGLSVEGDLNVDGDTFDLGAGCAFSATATDLLMVAGGGSNRGLELLGALNCVDGVKVTAVATGGTVRIEAEGTDANIPLVVAPQGTGILTLGTGAAGGQVRIGGAGGSLISFFNSAPIARPAASADLAVTGSIAGGDTVDATVVLAALNAIQNGYNAFVAKFRQTGGLGLISD